MLNVLEVFLEVDQLLKCGRRTAKFRFAITSEKLLYEGEKYLIEIGPKGQREER